jgi:hypothetical protein
LKKTINSIPGNNYQEKEGNTIIQDDNLAHNKAGEKQRRLVKQLTETLVAILSTMSEAFRVKELVIIFPAKTNI